MFKPNLRRNPPLEIWVLAGIALICLALMANLRFAWESWDDETYRLATSPDGPYGGNLFTYLSQVLNTWTSRVAIEAAVFTFINRTLWWRLATALAFWLVIALPPYLITPQRHRRVPLLISNALLVLSIPGTVWFDAGYIATTINYLWVLATGLLAALPAILFLQHRPFSPWWYLAAVPAALFAGSSEIVSLLLLVGYLLALGALFWHNRISNKVKAIDNADDAVSPVETLALPGNWKPHLPNPLILGGFSVFLAGMVAYHLFSPGNAARGRPNWLSPTFPILFERAYSSTLRQMFMSGYVIPLGFFVVIAIMNYRSRGLTWLTVVSFIPVAGSLLLRDAQVPGTTGTVFQNLFSDGNLLWDTSQPAIISTWYRDNLFAVLVLTLLLLTAIVAVISAISATYPNDRVRLITILGILAAGFATKFIVVNTIGHALEIQFHRTDLYLLFAFAAATLILIAPLVGTLPSLAVRKTLAPETPQFIDAP